MGNDVMGMDLILVDFSDRSVDFLDFLDFHERVL